jgi:hypothetical protein
LAGAKLPSRKASSHFSRPFSSNSPSSVRRALSQIPVSSHCFNRRHHVDGEGYSSGKKRMPLPFAVSTECLPNSCGSAREDVPDHPCVASVPATAALSTTTALPTTASVDSS